MVRCSIELGKILCGQWTIKYDTFTLRCRVWFLNRCTPYIRASRSREESREEQRERDFKTGVLPILQRREGRKLAETDIENVVFDRFTLCSVESRRKIRGKQRERGKRANPTQVYSIIHEKRSKESSREDSWFQRVYNLPRYSIESGNNDARTGGDRECGFGQV